MSSKVIFPLEKIKVKKKLLNRIKEVFGLEFGDFFTYEVTVRFQKLDGSWLENTTDMFFDTGAVITLLPKDMFSALGLNKFVSHKMIGVIKKEECKLPLKICRVKARLEDGYGNISPAFEIWVAICDP